MYRLGLTKLVLEVYHYYRKSNMLSLVNQTSLKYVMLCAAEEKDRKTLYSVFNSQSDRRKDSVVLNGFSFDGTSCAATFIRCLLSLNEVKQATDLLSAYLENPVYKRSNVTGGNDLYSNAIVGSFFLSHQHQASTRATTTTAVWPPSTPSAPSLPLSPSPPSTT